MVTTHSGQKVTILNSFEIQQNTKCNSLRKKLMDFFNKVINLLKFGIFVRHRMGKF